MFVFLHSERLMTALRDTFLCSEECRLSHHLKLDADFIIDDFTGPGALQALMKQMEGKM